MGKFVSSFAFHLSPIDALADRSESCIEMCTARPDFASDSSVSSGGVVIILLIILILLFGFGGYRMGPGVGYYGGGGISLILLIILILLLLKVV
jgi:hypothetical protein